MKLLRRCKIAKADKLSYDKIGETCPILDNLVYDTIKEIDKLELESDVSNKIEEIINELIEDVKKYATIPLRDNLTETCGDLLRLEDDIESLEYDKRHFEDEVGSLSSQLEIANSRIIYLEDMMFNIEGN